MTHASIKEEYLAIVDPCLHVVIADEDKVWSQSPLTNNQAD